jgi:hypothetical protein
MPFQKGNQLAKNSTNQRILVLIVMRKVFVVVAKEQERGLFQRAPYVRSGIAVNRACRLTDREG